jgi:hypothetical protein
VNLLDPEPYEEDMFSFENGTVVIMKKEKGEAEGKRLTIVDVLYKRTASGFEKDFLYKDSDGNLAILDKSKIDMVQELDKVAINLTDMKNLTTIKLKNNGVRLMSSEFLLSLVEKAGVGYYIMVNNKPEIV